MLKKIKEYSEAAYLQLELFWAKYMMTITMSFLLFSFVVIYFADNIFITVGPGEAGVLWKRFKGGIVMNRVYNEGQQILWPWDRMYIYETRVQEMDAEIQFLDTSGMIIDTKVSLRYRPYRETLPQLHKTLGPKYRERLIQPELVSALRIVMGTKPYQEIYTQSERSFLNEISRNLSTELDKHHILVEHVLLKGLFLPEKLSEAIKRKLIYEQELQAYDYRLKSEEQERIRKAIEGQGIAEFEANSGISILQWRGIAATEKFADSPNTKIIIVGNDAGSLPIILNSEDK